MKPRRLSMGTDKHPSHDFRPVVAFLLVRFIPHLSSESPADVYVKAQTLGLCFFAFAGLKSQKETVSINYFSHVPSSSSVLFRASVAE